jgi:hypothetical protein
MEAQALILWDIAYHLDGGENSFHGRILAPSAAGILDQIDRYVCRGRLCLISVKPTQPPNRKQIRREAGVHANVYRRFIPPKWATATAGRTDMSLEAATDGHLTIYEVEATGLWSARMQMEDARNALCRHPWRSNQFALNPFNIDIISRSIDQVFCPSMEILWRAAA